MHRAEGMGAEEVAEFMLGAVEADVMPEASSGAGPADAGLRRVDFPGVDVEHGGAVGGVYFGDRCGGDAAREQTEVTATDRDREAVDLRCSGREFQNGAAGRGEGVDLFLSVGHPVAVMAGDGENAAVVRETLLGQDVECPQGAFDDRKTGRSVSGHSDPAGVVNSIDRGGDIGRELLGGEVIDQPVPVAVRGDFMSSLGDAADERGEAFSDPAEYEKCRSDAAVVKQSEQPVGVCFDPALVLIPVVSGNTMLERGDLVIVFDVDRQGMTQGAWFGRDGRGRVAWLECGGQANGRGEKWSEPVGDSPG